jgi:predicted RecB family endonuclease
MSKKDLTLHILAIFGLELKATDLTIMESDIEWTNVDPWAEKNNYYAVYVALKLTSPQTVIIRIREILLASEFSDSGESL